MPKLQKDANSVKTQVPRGIAENTNLINCRQIMFYEIVDKIMFLWKCFHFPEITDNIFREFTCMQEYKCI